MAVEASAHEILGVAADADFPEIDRAYKRLIKQHHPDRPGGDALRAAEINRAYRELCAEQDHKSALEFHDEGLSDNAGGRAWLTLAVLLAGATIFLLFAQSPLGVLKDGFARPTLAGLALGNHRRATPKADAMDAPLQTNVIDASVRDALRLSRSSDEMGLARFSRDCHHRLRSSPSMAQFDRCASFDDAVVLLQDRDPLRDQGPFGELAVTGRIWSGAAALSDDSVSIDGRLDRIRLRVEMAVAPLIEAAKPAAARN